MVAELKFGVGTQTTVLRYKGVMNDEEKSDKCNNNNNNNNNNEVLIDGQNALTVTREHSAGSYQLPICRSECSPLFLHPVCFVVIHPSLKP
jgi:hypothetical protein